MTSLHGMIERAARLNPTGIATRCNGRQYSWTESRGRMARLAAALQTTGLAEGDRIAILSLNSDRYYESIFAVSWAGFCVVPLNTRWAVAENKYALGDSGTSVLLFDDDFAEPAGELLEALEGLSLAIHMVMGTAQAGHKVMKHSSLKTHPQPPQPGVTPTWRAFSIPAAPPGFPRESFNHAVHSGPAQSERYPTSR